MPNNAASIRGTLSFETRLSSVLQDIIKLQHPGTSTLRLVDRPGNSIGDIVIANGKYVCGAILRKWTTQAEICSGYPALRALCASASAEFEYLITSTSLVKDLTLNIDLNSLIKYVPELPANKQLLQNDEVVMNRIFGTMTRIEGWPSPVSSQSEASTTPKSDLPTSTDSLADWLPVSDLRHAPGSDSGSTEAHYVPIPVTHHLNDAVHSVADVALREFLANSVGMLPNTLRTLTNTADRLPVMLNTLPPALELEPNMLGLPPDTYGIEPNMLNSSPTFNSGVAPPEALALPSESGPQQSITKRTSRQLVPGTWGASTQTARVPEEASANDESQPSHNADAEFPTSTPKVSQSYSSRPRNEDDGWKSSPVSLPFVDTTDGFEPAQDDDDRTSPLQGSENSSTKQQQGASQAPILVAPVKNTGNIVSSARDILRKPGSRAMGAITATAQLLKLGALLSLIAIAVWVARNMALDFHPTLDFMKPARSVHTEASENRFIRHSTRVYAPRRREAHGSNTVELNRSPKAVPISPKAQPYVTAPHAVPQVETVSPHRHAYQTYP